MTLPARFSLLSSEFNGFLYATIGTENNDMPLSVISALTRLGLDPWQEAARLAALPRAAASRALAATLARLQGGAWMTADAESIAARLVDLLPGKFAVGNKIGGFVAPRIHPTRDTARIWLIRAVVMAVSLSLAWMVARLWLT